MPSQRQVCGLTVDKSKALAHCIPRSPKGPPAAASKSVPSSIPSGDPARAADKAAKEPAKAVDKAAKEAARGRVARNVLGEIQPPAQPLFNNPFTMYWPFGPHP
jgi:hypothetical protein